MGLHLAVWWLTARPWEKKEAAELHSLFCGPGQVVISGGVKHRVIHHRGQGKFLREILQLGKRKHFPCFYRVVETQVEVWEIEKCCGNTSRRRVFPQLFRVLPNFPECFYNSIETRRKRFLFLLENSPRKITKNEEHLIALFIIKMKILYTAEFTRHKLRHHLCISIEL